MNDDSLFQQKQIAQEYEKYYETKYRRADLLEKKLLTKLFGQFQNVRKVLEVGCGTGHFTRWMESALGFECYGVDTSKAMLSEARQMWPKASLLESEAIHLPFKPKSFDIVTFITSLEYMPDAASALNEAARVAKEGIIIGLMNKKSPSTARKMLRAKTMKDSFYRNAKFYSVSDIEKKLPEESAVVFCCTTVFPKVFGSWESSLFPFGGFLGIAVKLRG